MKSLLYVFFFCVCFSSATSSAASQDHTFAKVTGLYSQGKYLATINELERLEQNPRNDKKTQGLIAYWKGMANNRNQNYIAAIESFKRSLKLGYSPVDLNYELGQAYFAAEKLKEAREQFNLSFDRSFKRGPSLYYMAFISKELGHTAEARKVFAIISTLTEPDIIEVKQASQMQIGDIALEEAEKKSDVFNKVENKVIPIYEEAYLLNPESPLAPRIKEKIKSLQQKYELVLFQLRNGRPTAIPPYFLRVAQEFGYDTNVTFSPTETTISKSKQASIYSKSEVFGRYTFYHKNFLALSPELRFNSTHYFNRVPEIYRNDNTFLAPALRTSLEHTMVGKPASVLFDYDYNEAKRDVNSEKRLVFGSRAHNFMLGERFNYFSKGETTLRLKRRIFESYISNSDSKAISFIFEQVVSLKESTLLFYGSYDRTRVNTEAFDTNAMTMRTDWLLASYKNWFTPSLGLGVTRSDPINDRSNRGIEWLLNPSLRLSKSFGKNWRVNSRLEHSRNVSKDKENFDYKRNLVASELEYIF